MDHNEQVTEVKKAAFKKAAKKAPAPKAVAKKAAKKAAPAAAVKKAVKKTTTIVAPKVDGLRKPQVRILAALAKAGKALTRKQISEKAPVDNAFCTEYLGSLDEEVRAKNDEKSGKSLLTLKFIKHEQHDIDGKDTTVYSITAAGKAALDKATKEAAAK